MNRGEIGQINLGGNAGMRPALILTRQGVIPTVPKVRFDKYLGTLDPTSMRAVGQKLILALGLEDSI